MNRKQKFLKFVQNKNNIKKILVVRNGELGDTIFITNVLSRLNYTFPLAMIDVVVAKNCEQVLENFPGIRNIISFKFDFTLLSIIKQMFLFILLIFERYDIIIVQDSNPHYTLMIFLFFSNVSIFISFASRVSFSSSSDSVVRYSNTFVPCIKAFHIICKHSVDLPTPTSPRIQIADG